MQRRWPNPNQGTTLVALLAAGIIALGYEGCARDESP